jgi:hypothetical protein
VATASGYASMGYSRGASAIGVAKALGEIGAQVGERQVLKDWTLYSSVASCSAGIELMHNVMIHSYALQSAHAVTAVAADLVLTIASCFWIEAAERERRRLKSPIWRFQRNGKMGDKILFRVKAA